MPASTPALTPGTKVKITQQIAARDRTWVSETVGTVIEFQQRPTGSWFAHSRDDKLWLDRLVIQKADGEISILNLDDLTVVETL